MKCSLKDFCKVFAYSPETFLVHGIEKYIKKYATSLIIIYRNDVYNAYTIYIPSLHDIAASCRFRFSKDFPKKKCYYDNTVYKKLHALALYI